MWVPRETRRTVLIAVVGAGALVVGVRSTPGPACGVTLQPDAGVMGGAAHASLLRIEAGGIASRTGRIVVYRVPLSTFDWPATGVTLYAEVRGLRQSARCRATGGERVDLVLRSRGAMPVVRVASSRTIDIVLDRSGEVVGTARFDGPETDSLVLAWPASSW
jgi:hypothetical protein